MAAHELNRAYFLHAHQKFLRVGVFTHIRNFIQFRLHFLLIGQHTLNLRWHVVRLGL